MAFPQQILPTAKARPATAKPTSEERRRMIAEAAYYKALARQLEGGDPVADWLEAEREIADRLAQEEKLAKAA